MTGLCCGAKIPSLLPRPMRYPVLTSRRKSRVYLRPRRKHRITVRLRPRSVHPIRSLMLTIQADPSSSAVRRLGDKGQSKRRPSRLTSFRQRQP